MTKYHVIRQAQQLPFSLTIEDLTYNINSMLYHKANHNPQVTTVLPTTDEFGNTGYVAIMEWDTDDIKDSEEL